MNNLNTQAEPKTFTLCYHCGNDCDEEQYHFDDKNFCCVGCQSVYKILSENQLCNYYAYNNTPGKTQNEISTHFDYLDEPKIAASLLDYADDSISIITFYIPAIHVHARDWKAAVLNWMKG